MSTRPCRPLTTTPRRSRSLRSRGTGAATLLVTLSLVLFAVARSKRLSDFLEAMSDERLDGHAKWSSLARVFRKPEH